MPHWTYTEVGTSGSSLPLPLALIIQDSRPKPLAVHPRIFETEANQTPWSNPQVFFKRKDNEHEIWCMCVCVQIQIGLCRITMTLTRWFIISIRYDVIQLCLELFAIYRTNASPLRLTVFFGFPSLLLEKKKIRLSFSGLGIPNLILLICHWPCGG